MFGPISGAHFNPAVSLVFWVNKKLSNKDFFYYVISQIIFGLLAIFIIHYIFHQQIMLVSTYIRGEFLAPGEIQSYFTHISCNKYAVNTDHSKFKFFLLFYKISIIIVQKAYLI